MNPEQIEANGRVRAAIATLNKELAGAPLVGLEVVLTRATRPAVGGLAAAIQVAATVAVYVEPKGK